MQYVLIILLLLSAPCYAATGDVLWSCNFETGATVDAAVEGCGGGANTNNQARASIVASGGWDNGKYANFSVTDNTDVYDPIWLTGATVNKAELTTTYYEKFDVANAGYLWNVKSSRILSATGTFYLGFVGRENGNYWQQTTVPNREVIATFTSAVAGVNTSVTPHCDVVSGNDYNCSNGNIQITATPSFTDTSWHKVRIYVKWPSGEATTDGAVMVWIDEVLIYTISNLSGAAGVGSYIGEVRYHPSDAYIGDFQEAFNHSYDDIVIYEGYVPPASSQGESTIAVGAFSLR